MREPRALTNGRGLGNGAASVSWTRKMKPQPKTRPLHHGGTESRRKQKISRGAKASSQQLLPHRRTCPGVLFQPGGQVPLLRLAEPDAGVHPLDRLFERAIG